MLKTEEIFKQLSEENKALKPDYAYKAGQQGLLRAFYFFRWCNKNNLGTIDKIVEQFIKGNMPEQQAEHYGSALVLIDHYDTSKEVKDAILYIEKQVYEQTRGQGPLDIIKPSKVQRRVLKNIYKTLEASIGNLKNRTDKLGKTSTGVWITLAVLLLGNVLLAVFGIYSNVMKAMFPSIMSGQGFMPSFGGYVTGLVVFVILSAVLLYFNRHRLVEQVTKSSDYPQEVKKMKKTLNQFEMLLKEKNIRVG